LVVICLIPLTKKLQLSALQTDLTNINLITGAACLRRISSKSMPKGSPSCARF
jgi:hypothetical protein